MNEIEKEKQELREAFQFCQDHNLFYKDELEKLKSNLKLLLICEVHLLLSEQTSSDQLRGQEETVSGEASRGGEGQLHERVRLISLLKATMS